MINGYGQTLEVDICTFKINIENSKKLDKYEKVILAGSAVVVNVSLHVLSIPDIDPAKKVRRP